MASGTYNVTNSVVISAPGCIGSLTFPVGVTGIANAVFSGESVTSVTFPDSLTSLGDDAFRSDTTLETVTFGTGLTSISQYAFASTGLTSLTLPASITSVGVGSFYGDSGLVTLTLPSTLTNVNSDAFANESSLTTLDLGTGLTSIGQVAFSNDPALTNLTIPDGVTSVGSYAFVGDTSLTQYSYCGTTLTYATLRAAGLAHKLNACPGAPSDTTDYNNAIAAVGTLTASNFTNASWAALQATMNPVLTDTSTQATVDAGTLAITTATSALVHVADLTAYNAAMAQAAALHSADYTSGSWAGLQATLTPVLDNQSSQADVDAATAAINDALGRLAAAPVVPPQSPPPPPPTNNAPVVVAGPALQNPLKISSASLSIHLGESVALTVSGGSGSGAVIFNDATPSICSVDATGLVAGTAVGNCQLSAVKLPDLDHFANTSPLINISILDIDKAAADKAAADKAAADKAAADKAAADKAAADKAAADKAAADIAQPQPVPVTVKVLPISLSVSRGSTSQAVTVSLSLTSKYGSQNAKVQLLQRAISKGKSVWKTLNLGSVNVDQDGVGKLVTSIANTSLFVPKVGQQVRVSVGGKALAWLTISSL